jgi:hypothetical protein
LRRVTHPGGQRRRVIDHDVPSAIFERVELTVAVADKLLDFGRQFAGMRFTTVERRHFVSAAQRIFHLIRASEAGPTEYENAHGCRCLLCK